MDDFLKSRFRTVGVVTLLILVVFFVVLLFVQYREKKNTAFKLKVIYSDIIQSLLMSKNYNGVPGEWGWKPGYKNIDLIEFNVFSQLKIARNCLDTPGDCMPDVKYKSIKEKVTNVNLHNYPSVRLRNGIAIAIETVGKCKRDDQVCAFMYVDLNGYEEPNAFGKDLFLFQIVNNESAPLKVYGEGLSTSELISHEKFGCNKDASMALYCSALIKANEWKITSEYPW